MESLSAIARQIWDMKYRLKSADGSPVDQTVEDSWHRVAGALARPEAESEPWAVRFFEALSGFRFLPAGRILAGAGTGRDVTLFNCFVMGTIPDDMAGIFAHLREAALTLQQGGGIGYDFSTLRPKGAPVHGVGADASGPLSFMDVWDAMCRTIMSAGYRRGAMMATLRCDHPDIQAFVRAKAEPGRLRMFNLSVLVTDPFMRAVRENAEWPLVFGGKTFAIVQARELWDEIMRATYEYAEPGVIFIDRINRLNNLSYLEEIYSTNPCGEQPLPPYGACLLGSINLASLVRAPFSGKARLDIKEMERLIPVAVRMLDNAIDASRFPLDRQREEAVNKRRIGLGVTGLGDALIMCRRPYGSAEAVALTEQWMKVFRDSAYRASIELAREKGPFPLFDRDKYLAGEGVAALPKDLRDAIAEHGIRNALVTSIAPTGTISLLADNVSSGIEPVFSYRFTRSVLMPDGSRRDEEVVDYACREFHALKGDDAKLPDYFTDSRTLAPEAHIVMQAAVQKFIDSSISKTVNLPDDIAFEDFKDVYLRAYELGCKGCTTYRPNIVTGAVLSPAESEKESTEADDAVPESQPGIVYMTQPLERPEELVGKTYKLRWPESEHAFYVTVNDIVQDGRRRPFEVFINSANLEHYAWTVALTRMISAVFRRGGDVTFVVRELKSIFDPRGGSWMDGRYVPSLLAAIGNVIEQHMVDIGFISEPERTEVIALEQAVGESPRRFCPKCNQPGLIHREGCDLCPSCGYSKCS
jgi:ribonucleoside-diphosphate reductase alpha chain